MNRKDAIDACREIMMGPRAYESERLDRIAEALLPWTEEKAQWLLAGTGHSEEPSTGMKWRSQTNFLPLVLDVYSPEHEGRQLPVQHHERNSRPVGVVAAQQNGCEADWPDPGCA